MNNFSGKYLNDILLERNFSFRDACKAFKLPAEKMKKLLNLPFIEESDFKEIIERLNLGIEIENLKKDVAVLRSILILAQEIFKSYSPTNPLFVEFDELVKKAIEKTDRE